MKNDRLTLLAIRMKAGNRKAAEELYGTLNSKVYGFFFSRTGARKEVAEDLTQDIFVRLVQRVESYDVTRGRFVVWFWQIARNVLIDYYRGKKEVSLSSFEPAYVESLAVAPEPDFDDRLKRSRVNEILDDLNDSDRELFTLRYVADLSYRDISEILGKSEGSLRVASLRIKEKIRKEKIWASWDNEPSARAGTRKEEESMK